MTTFDAAHQEELARGWPYFRVLTDAPFEKKEHAAFNAALANDHPFATHFFVEWPRAAARGFVRDFAADARREKYTFADQRPVAAKELPGLLGTLLALDPSPRQWLIEDFLLILEAELGGAAVFDALHALVCPVSEGTEPTRSWIDASWLLLRRMSAAEREKRLSSLASWAAELAKRPASKLVNVTRGRASLLQDLELVRTGKSPNRDANLLRRNKEKLVHATKDAEVVRLACEGDALRPTALPSALLLFVGGEAATRELLDFKWLNEDHEATHHRRFLQHLERFSSPAALQLVGELALKSKAKAEALAVLQRHPEEARAALTGAKFKPLVSKLGAGKKKPVKKKK